MGNLAALVPLLAFMAGMVGIGFYVRREAAGSGFLQNYFVGNRSLGGFVLAMTTVATYSSVSSFVGGPGMAWKIGFGWIYMAVVQVTAIFLVLGIFGKRVAILSRRLNAVTVVDIIRARFRSDFLAGMAAFIIVLFFCGTTTAQFVGGAKLFSTVTGYSYETGLLLFGVVVVRRCRGHLHCHRRFPRRGPHGHLLRHHHDGGHRPAPLLRAGSRWRI